MRKCWS